MVDFKMLTVVATLPPLALSIWVLAKHGKELKNDCKEAYGWVMVLLVASAIVALLSGLAFSRLTTGLRERKAWIDPRMLFAAYLALLIVISSLKHDRCKCKETRKALNILKNWSGLTAGYVLILILVYIAAPQSLRRWGDI